MDMKTRGSIKLLLERSSSEEMTVMGGRGDGHGRWR
jgi:hypothetical protein